MGGKMKKVIYWVLGIVLVMTVLGGVSTTLTDAVDNVTTEYTATPIIGTIASFWWIGVVILLIGVIVSSFKSRGGFRRRRRR